MDVGTSEGLQQTQALASINNSLQYFHSIPISSYFIGFPTSTACQSRLSLSHKFTFFCRFNRKPSSLCLNSSRVAPPLLLSISPPSCCSGFIRKGFKNGFDGVSREKLLRLSLWPTL